MNPEVTDALQRVAEAHGVSVDALSSRSRFAHLVKARKDAVGELWELNYSVSAIAEILDRTHGYISAVLTELYPERAVERAKLLAEGGKSALHEVATREGHHRKRASGKTTVEEFPHLNLGGEPTE